MGSGTFLQGPQQQGLCNCVTYGLPTALLQRPSRRVGSEARPFPAAAFTADNISKGDLWDASLRTTDFLGLVMGMKASSFKCPTMYGRVHCCMRFLRETCYVRYVSGEQWPQGPNPEATTTSQKKTLSICRPLSMLFWGAQSKDEDIGAINADDI